MINFYQLHDLMSGGIMRDVPKKFKTRTSAAGALFHLMRQALLQVSNQDQHQQVTPVTTTTITSPAPEHTDL